MFEFIVDITTYISQSKIIYSVVDYDKKRTFRMALFGF